ncbi:MAG: hypothetical protein Q8M99_08970 [Methylotenera sp.]|nr:hypothetical protein [Methylotenera sp.]
MVLNANNFALTLFFGLVFVTFANSKCMTADEYKFLENDIDADFIRIASKTDQDKKYRGVFNAQSDSLIKKADSDYLLAMQKCNSKASADKLMREKNAKITRQKEIDNASTQMKIPLPKAETLQKKRSTNSNDMPMIDDLTPAFKKSRLI